MGHDALATGVRTSWAGAAIPELQAPYRNPDASARQGVAFAAAQLCYHLHNHRECRALQPGSCRRPISLRLRCGVPMSKGSNLVAERLVVLGPSPCALNSKLLHNSSDQQLRTVSGTLVNCEFNVLTSAFGLQGRELSDSVALARCCRSLG